MGDVAGVAAAAAAQLPTPEMAATDPSLAAATIERLAAEHPASEGGRGVSGWDGSAAFAASGPGRGYARVGARRVSRRVGALRATRRKLAAAGSNAATSARAAAEVASPATAATARRAGAIVAALLSHGAGQKH